jgi:hypothetical protein
VEQKSARESQKRWTAAVAATAVGDGARGSGGSGGW